MCVRIIKLLPEKPEPVLLADIFARICSLGRISLGSGATARGIKLAKVLFMPTGFLSYKSYGQLERESKAAGKSCVTDC